MLSQELGAVQSRNVGNVLLRDPKMNHKDHKYGASDFYPNVFWFLVNTYLVHREKQFSYRFREL